MTVAPTTVAPPAVRPPLGGLLPVANVIEASDPHVALGVQYQSFLCESGGYTQGCVPAAAGVPVAASKEFTGSHIVDGVPVTIYAGVECDLFGAPYTTEAGDRLAGAEDRLISQAFYAAIVLPAWNNSSAPVFDVGTDVDVCSEEGIVAALAQLEQYAGENYAGLPVIHMSRHTATYAIARSLLVPNLDGTLQTLQGTPVANAAGYPDCAMFVTGQVNAWRTPVATHAAPDLGANTALALAERTYVLATDCLLAIAGPTTAPDSVDLSVPSPTSVPLNTPTVYVSHLVNTGGTVDEAAEIIRFHSDDGPLAPADVVYETYRNGAWETAAWTQDGGDLVSTYTATIPFGTVADRQHRVTVTRDVGHLEGTSTITGDWGAVLATQSYTFNVGS